MKKLFCLALSLIMFVGLLPVMNVSAVSDFDLTLANTLASKSTWYTTDNYYLKSAEGVKFDLTSTTATLSGEMAQTVSNYTCMTFKDVCIAITNHMTQTIKIDDMPIFSQPTYTRSVTASGYYNILTRNYRTATATPLPAGKGIADCHDVIMYSIYRKDADGNLGMQLYNVYGGQAVTQEVPLAKKLGDTFVLTTIWHVDNRVTFYCDGESLGTFEKATFAEARTAARRESLTMGYASANAEGKGTVKLTVSNVSLTDEHAPVADDGDCTTDLYCSTCGEVAVAGLAAHKPAIANAKYPTETETGYTGDQVCYLCNHDIAKGEVIPVLEKTAQTGSNSDNQGVDNGVIFVYIGIGVVVLAAAAVVAIIIVKRKKQNQK